jgi:hypothetical protein
MTGDYGFLRMAGTNIDRLRDVNSCFCMGPQNGEPLCRCQMRDVIIRDGRYIKVERERDLGPVPTALPQERTDP